MNSNSAGVRKTILRPQKMIGMGSKSAGAQKTVWRPQKVIGMRSKSRDTQKAICMPQEVETVADKFSEVLQAIYKHKEVLAEIGSPAANSGSGTEYIQEVISDQGILTLHGNEKIFGDILEMLQQKIILGCILMIK